MSNIVDLSGKTALITGASRGIGAAAAQALAGAGAHVILLARTQGALEELDDQIRSAGGAATLMAMDLRKLDDIDRLAPAIMERFGGLDILIGNAAMLGPLTPVHQVAPKDWQKVFTLNVEANIRLVRALDPLLRAAEAGRIVFTTSGLGFSPLAYWGPYCLSKAALNIFAQTYAEETRQTRLKINLVSPGPVDTDMLGEAFPGGFKGKMKKPEDIAPLYVRLSAPDCPHHGEIIEP